MIAAFSKKTAFHDQPFRCLSASGAAALTAHFPFRAEYYSAAPEYYRANAHPVRILHETHQSPDRCLLLPALPHLSFPFPAIRISRAAEDSTRDIRYPIKPPSVLWNRSSNSHSPRPYKNWRPSIRQDSIRQNPAEKAKRSTPQKILQKRPGCFFRLPFGLPGFLSLIFPAAPSPVLATSSPFLLPPSFSVLSPRLRPSRLSFHLLHPGLRSHVSRSIKNPTGRKIKMFPII